MKYLLLLLLPVMSLASEGDAFTARLYNDYEDMEPALNKEVNARINNALLRANKELIKSSSTQTCQIDVAMQSMKKEFLRPVVGKFEYWSTHNDVLKGHYIKLNESIYKDINFKENWPVHFGKLGMATFYKINKTLVASDKFGHFFDEGYTYFEMVEQGKTIQDAMNKGIELENGIYGLERSQVYSYADLVANRQGYEFWKSLFHDKDGKNIIGCTVTNMFYLKTPFEFKNYVDDGWDEGINCSEYSNKSVEDRVMNVIKDLEDKHNKKLTCPAERYKCPAIVEKYKDEKEYLINPKCY